MASAQVRPPAQPAALLPKLTVVCRLAPGDHDYNVALARGDKAEAASIKREAVVSKPVRASGKLPGFGAAAYRLLLQTEGRQDLVGGGDQDDVA